MGKNEKTPITVNDKEYFVEDLNDQQKTFVNHINDLNEKWTMQNSTLINLHLGIRLCDLLLCH